MTESGNNKENNKKKEKDKTKKIRIEETIPSSPEEPEDSEFTRMILEGPEEPNDVPPFKIKKPTKRESEKTSSKKEGDEDE